MTTKTLRPACFLPIAAPVWLALPLLAATAARAQTYTLTTLTTITGTNGAKFEDALTFDYSVSLRGTTTADGASNEGTAFTIAGSTSTLTSGGSRN